MNLKYLKKLKYIFSTLIRPYSFTYIGGSSFFLDALDVLHRFTSGESVGEGPNIHIYEQDLENYHRVNHAITFGSGRMALYAILKAMNLQLGDEIILPGYTCIVTSNAIHYAGLKPVYVDVSLENFNIDLEKLKKAITPKTKAILAQHTFGIPCNLDILTDIYNQYGIPIIEDGAHAIGARWRGEVVGRFGLAAFFSTEGSKMFSTERGGYALTDDNSLANRIRNIQEEASFFPLQQEKNAILRWCYRAAILGNPYLTSKAYFFQTLAKKFSFSRFIEMLEFDKNIYKDELNGRRFIPYPARLGNLMSYAASLQLNRLEDELEHRRKLANYLTITLPLLGANVACYDHKLALPSWVRFPFYVDYREKWITEIRRCFIQPGYWLDNPVHPKECDWRIAEYKKGMCPNGEYLGEHILNLPVHRRISLNRIKNIIKNINKK